MDRGKQPERGNEMILSALEKLNMCRSLNIMGYTKGEFVPCPDNEEKVAYAKGFGSLFISNGEFLEIYEASLAKSNAEDKWYATLDRILSVPMSDQLELNRYRKDDQAIAESA